MSQPPQGPPPRFSGPPQGPPLAMSDAPTQYLPVQGPPPQGPPPQGPPPQGPPPGYPAAPAQQFGPPGLHGRRSPVAGRPRSKTSTAIWVLGLISVTATVVGLSVQEDGRNAWDSVNAWGGLAILGAVLTLAPVLRSSVNLTAHRAWQVAAGGAAALGLFWVLFVLPAAGSNTSLVTTVGAAAGIVAVWIAPGREDAAGHPPGHGW